VLSAEEGATAAAALDAEAAKLDHIVEEVRQLVGGRSASAVPTAPPTGRETPTAPVPTPRPAPKRTRPQPLARGVTSSPLQATASGNGNGKGFTDF
jgi:hypothetical protein